MRIISKYIYEREFMYFSFGSECSLCTAEGQFPSTKATLCSFEHSQLQMAVRSNIQTF